MDRLVHSLQADHRLVAILSLIGMALDLLGGAFLAYDLLGGKRGPLRLISVAVGYVSVFFAGYLIVMGFTYAAVAAVGMGLLLAFELRTNSSGHPPRDPKRRRSVLFGFLRGLVLGLASWPIAGPTFAAPFGLLAGVGLSAAYLAGYSPVNQYASFHSSAGIKTQWIPSALRATACAIAGTFAGLLAARTDWPVFGLRLGAAAGLVSITASLCSPVIERWIENLPERRLGVIGLQLIGTGFVLQSVQYWLVLLRP